MLTAEKIILREFNRRYQQMTIQRGYGYLVAKGKRYFFHVSEMPALIRKCIDIRKTGAVENLPQYLPQVTFDSQTSPKGPRAKNIRISAIAEDAAIQVEADPDTDMLQMLVPKLEGKFYFLHNSDAAPVNPGRYTATVYPAIGESTLRRIYLIDPATLKPGNPLPEIAGDALNRRLDQIPAMALDMESDGRQIFQIGLRFKGKTLALDEKKHPGAITRLIQNLSRLSRDILLIGHNIREWDLLILRRHGLDSRHFPVWDTLRVETLLSPRLEKYSLKTTHHARDDVELTWKLFLNQLSRLYLSQVRQTLMSAEIPREYLALYVDPIFREINTANSTTTAANPALDLLEGQRDAMLGIEPPKNHLSRQIQRLLSNPTRPRHLLFPALLLPYLKSLRRAVFYGPRDNESFYEVDPQKLQHFSGDFSYEADLLRSYYHTCRHHQYPPILGFMPEGIRRKISGNFAISEYASQRRYTPADNGSSNELIHCFPAGSYFAEINAGGNIPQAIPNVVMLFPELQRITAKYHLKEKPAAVIDHALKHLHIWTKFSCGQSYYRIETPDRSAILQAFGLSEDHPGGMDNLWIEKNHSGSYILWGNYRDLKAQIRERLPGAAISEITIDKSGGSAAGEIHFVNLKIPPRRKSDPDTIRLNPETPYRDRYWTNQSFILKQLTFDRPSVLFVAVAQEVKKLTGLFKHLGFHIPEHPALQRRIEQLQQSGRPHRILILTYDELLEFIGKPDTAGLQIIIDSLPLQEQWVLNPGVSPSPAVSEAKETLPEEDLPGDETLPDSADDPQADPASTEPQPSLQPELLRHDPLAALTAMLPLLKLVSQRLQEQGGERRLVVLDSHLQPYRSLAERQLLKTIDIPVWKHPEEYRLRLAEVQIYLRNVQPETRGFPEANWLETFQHIFIEGHQFREDQCRYLSRIMPREQDILVTLPTGGGKSVLFQAPALYRGLHTNRLTLVVSPLKALMIDQTEALWRKGFWNNVEAITGDMAQFEVKNAYRRLAGGELSMLFVAPERFRSKEFLKALAFRLSADGAPEFWVFDEAHCISQWGLDFRPDYLRAVSYIQQERKNGAYAPLILLSATVTEQVFNDLERVFS